MSKELTGAEIILEVLKENGVDTVFGYPGGAILPFYDELFKQNDIKHILVRHEQGAVHAAEGYARSTGKVGVVIVTSGPGATNTVTGLADALLDSVPIIVISGQVATPLIGTDAFQEADIMGITMPCTKHNYMVKDISKLADKMREAFDVALSGRPGPVAFDVPKDIQIIKHEYEPAEYKRRESYKPADICEAELIEEAVKAISEAKKPIFYTGGGVVNSGDKAAELLTEFIDTTGHPCTSTLLGLGAYPATKENFLGMLGMHGSYEANMAMAECDLMICVGARFDDRVTGVTSKFSPNSKKIHIDIDASSFNKTIKVDMPLRGDCELILEAMLKVWNEKKLKSADTSAWMNKITDWRKLDSIQYNQAEGADIIKPQYALDLLNTQLHADNKDFFVTTDVGQHQMWSAQYIKFNKPKRWMTSGGLGTMGYGLPAALGVAIGNPNTNVVCVSGEASVMMNIQEIATAVQYRLPIKLIILNNNYMGMVRQWQELFFGNRYSESYVDALPDFVALAEAFGIKGLRCEKPEDAESVLKEFIEHDGPVLLDMVVDQKENVYPMIPAGAAHNEMELDPSQRIEVDKDLAAQAV